MRSESERLLVAPETPVTCPQCEHEFSLAQGFAKRALEGLEQASAAALAELRSAEREEARKRVESLAAERTRGFVCPSRSCRRWNCNRAKQLTRIEVSVKPPARSDSH